MFSTAIKFMNMFWQQRKGNFVRFERNEHNINGPSAKGEGM